jgi:hypothetical protein
MEEKRSSLMLVVAMLLLPPAIYLGSYLALVSPGNYESKVLDVGPNQKVYVEGYRYFGDEDAEMARFAPRVFWPLEQLDRRLRPDAWESESFF